MTPSPQGDAARQLAKLGCVKYVAERLGDRDDTVVETYAHVTPRMRSSAVGKVRGFLGTDPGAGEGAVVRPQVVSEVDAFREPPVSPQASQGQADTSRGA